jgi:hypothetical protein
VVSIIGSTSVTAYTMIMKRSSAAASPYTHDTTHTVDLSWREEEEFSTYKNEGIVVCWCMSLPVKLKLKG